MNDFLNIFLQTGYLLCMCVQMAVSSAKGCVTVSQEGHSYSQNSELRWGNKSVKQGMKYQVVGPEPNGKNKLARLYVTANHFLLENKRKTSPYIVSFHAHIDSSTFCVVSSEARRECTASKSALAWTEFLLNPVPHTHCWPKFRATSEIAWNTRCCWDFAPQSL